MTFEKIRVNARVKLIGKVKTGNLLVAFSAFLRVVVYMLAVLVFVYSGYFYKNIRGRVFLALCGVVLLLGVILLCCTRTVKDRWFAAMSDGCNVRVVDLVVRFTFLDVLNSVCCCLLSLVLSFIRIGVFSIFPSAVAAATIHLVHNGVSRSVFFVLLCGLGVITFCSAFFLVVSLGCISLARSLCFCSVRRFKYILSSLEKCCFSIFRFSLFLSVINRCTRRFSKLEFARFIYTFL